MSGFRTHLNQASALPGPAWRTWAPLVALLVFALALTATWWQHRRAPVMFVQGGCLQSGVPWLPVHIGDARITFCAGGDVDTSSLTTAFSSGAKRLSFFYSGYTTGAGLGVFLERADGERHRIPLPDAGEQWMAGEVEVPHRWREQPVRIVMEDRAVGVRGWAGLVDVRPTRAFNAPGLARLLALLAVVHMLWVAGLATFMTRESEEEAAGCFLICLGGASWVAAAAFFGSRALGTLWSVLVAAAVALALWRQSAHTLRRSVTLANRRLLPVTSYTLLVLLIGYFPLFEADAWLKTAANRWEALPPDNVLPLILAKQLWTGSVSVPMLGDWLSSDRPPLQAGAYLLFFAHAQGDLAYQVLASMLQALVLLPASMILRRCTPALVTPALVALGASSFLAVHVLFVWPKLAAATYVLLALVIAAVPGMFGTSPLVRGVAIGACAALAMLCHGGAVFGLGGLALMYLASHVAAKVRTAAVAVACATLTYLPWMAYQRLADPPGNRLVKWHLAGMVEPNGLSVREALRTAYGSISLEEWLAGRWENMARLFGGSARFWTDTVAAVSASWQAPGDGSWALLRGASFFELTYSMWSLSPIVAALAWLAWSWLRGGAPLSSFDKWVAGSAVFSCLLAALALFAPGSAVLHQVSLSSWIGLFATSLLLLSRLPRAVPLAAIAVNVFVFAAAYVFSGSLPVFQHAFSAYTVLAGAAFALYASCCAQLGGEHGRPEGAATPTASHSPRPLPASTHWTSKRSGN